MTIVLAADGSRFATKAVDFLLNQQQWVHGDANEIIVINVQAPMISRSLPRSALAAHYEDVARAALKPVERLLSRHKVAWRSVWTIGYPAAEIVKLARKEKAQLIVMGTRGRSTLGRVFMGSVAQEVVSASKVPVLLVK
jgi:nucleotide-binding universal stress UspA family protein